MMDLAAEILSHGRGMRRKDIYDQLVERGVVIEGEFPVNNVGARLSDDPRFVTNGRGIWRLANPPIREDRGASKGISQFSIDSVVEGLGTATESASFDS